MNDLKFAIRRLSKEPGFTAVAVLTIALALGAATSVFSVFNAVLLRSLPVPNPQELRVLQWSGVEARVPSLEGHWEDNGKRVLAQCFSPGTFPLLREGAGKLAGVFAFASVDNFGVGLDGETITANGMVVSDNFFSGLDVRPRFGTTFLPGPSSEEAAQGVVISWGWYKRHFSGSGSVLGHPLTLKGRTFTIMGVLPPGFHGIQAGKTTDFYVLLAPGSPLLERPLAETRYWWLQLMARMDPKASAQGFEAVLTGIFAREQGGLMKEPRVVVEAGARGLTWDAKSYAKPLLLMLGIIGLVILASCANLAGLTLARNAARRHEAAVRAALGASLWRGVRQSLVESLLLSAIGGGFGVAFAIWGRAAVAHLLIGSAAGLHYNLSLDLRVLVFALGAATFTTLLSGGVPSLLSGTADPGAALKERGALSLSRLRSGRVLVIAQVTVSLLLLSGAGLCIRTLANLHRIDAGFDTDNLLLFQVRPMDAGYRGERLARYYQDVQSTLSTLPGVKGASLIMYPLLGEEDSMGQFSMPGLATDQGEKLNVHRLLVSAAFFRTMGIAFVHGGGWQKGDTNAVVVNKAFVKRFIPGREPIGQTIDIWGVTWHITGVCSDIRHQDIKETCPPTAYLSFLGRLVPMSSFVVRTAVPPRALAGRIRAAVGSLDARVPVTSLTTQNQVINATIGPERLFAELGGALGGFALLLSCLGLYGLMAYNVSRRRAEIAIRMAVGAQRRDVGAAIVQEAIALTVVGAGLGIPAALMLTRLIRNRLYGVRPGDPLTFALVVLTLGLVGLMSAILPAWRAMHTDPLTALRSE
jgi:predicted permease